MSADVAFSLQKAVYDALLADAAFAALIGDPPRLYDAPPRDVAYPYVILGEARVKDWPGVDGGLEHELRLQTYSRHEGRREVKAVLNAAYDVLHDAALTLDGAALVACRFVFSDIFPRAETGVYQGVARYRAVTTPAGTGS
ncbi:MAG: DUF3168 domain-containing protein [Pseudomonadota bacterium]